MSLIEQLEELFAVTLDQHALTAAVEPLLRQAETQPMAAVSAMKELLHWISEHAWHDDMYVMRELLAASTASHPCLAIALGKLLLAGACMSDFSWLLQRMDCSLQALLWKSSFERMQYVTGSFEQLAAFRAPRFRARDAKSTEDLLKAVFAVQRESERLLQMLFFADEPEVEEGSSARSESLSLIETVLLDTLQKIAAHSQETARVAAEIRFLTRTVLAFGYTEAAEARLAELGPRLEAPQRELLDACFKAAIRLEHE